MVRNSAIHLHSLFYTLHLLSSASQSHDLSFRSFPLIPTLAHSHSLALSAIFAPVLFRSLQVNFPKQKKTYCKRCKKHTLQGITWQKKAGKASLLAQGTYTSFMGSSTSYSLQAFALLSISLRRDRFIMSHDFVHSSFYCTYSHSLLALSLLAILHLRLGKRRYDRKQAGFGGQTKPVFRKNVKTTKKVVLKLKCTVCGCMAQFSLKRSLHVEVGGQKSKA